MAGEPFQKILIANRGEIACRIIRTARAMGYRTVSVFSDADANGLHVRMADEAVRIGAPPPSDSYLKIGAILDAASKTGADAVHPGYGFLAENAPFAEACEAAGLVFVGPPASVIRKMGDKAAAKSLLQAAGVPCVPGYLGDDQTDKRLSVEAGKLGFPLLIKAVAGGGGRGIRAVYTPGELSDQLAAARREAQSAFGDDRLMLERLVVDPRHLEVQVFGDSQGNVVHLFERDCTTQRRRQKIIEEAPSPALTPAARERLTNYAVEAARACGYRNAGTVEFIADRDLNIYFLEMNTRLQVEHPVTEMVTGLDLVEWQLRVAAGERLPLGQNEIALKGHAIEVRLCAEDPYDGFRPQTGTVVSFPFSTAPAGIRIDTGVEEGSEVSPFYDSMLAKVIAHGSDRKEATRRLAAALEDVPLLGLRTNQGFLARLLRDETFQQFTLATNTLDALSEAKAPLFQRPKPSKETWALAACFFAERGNSGEWFWSGSAFDFSIELSSGNERKSLRYSRSRAGSVSIAFDGTSLQIGLLPSKSPEVVFETGGVRRRALSVWQDGSLHLNAYGSSFVFHERQHTGMKEAGPDGSRIAAPVSGLLVKVFAVEGQTVEAGQTLALIEAMKMETRVTAVDAGRVASVLAHAGQQVTSGAVVFEIEKRDQPANV